MAFNEQGERKMFEGNWKCGECGAAIKELPFEPDPSKEGNLKCRDCFKNSRGGGGFSGGPRERKMFEGNWKCSGCGAAIKELPFEPDPSREGELKCRDCHRKGQNRF
jgi:DNA-directed RNA polymerase subunit RPC12/RpoP